LLREELALLILLGVVGALLVAAVRRVVDEDVSLCSLALSSVPVGICGFALFAVLFPVDALNARLQYRAMGGAAYLEFMRYESWLDVLLAAPVRAIYFQFAPFPLHVTSTFDLVAILSLPLLIALAVTAYRSIQAVETDSLVEILLGIVYVGGIVGYGLIDSNFGTTIRHRSVFVFLLAVFSAPILESWYRSLRQRVDKAIYQRRKTDENSAKLRNLTPAPRFDLNTETTLTFTKTARLPSNTRSLPSSEITVLLSVHRCSVCNASYVLDSENGSRPRPIGRSAVRPSRT